MRDKSDSADPFQYRYDCIHISNTFVIIRGQQFYDDSGKVRSEINDIHDNISLTRVI